MFTAHLNRINDHYRLYWNESQHESGIQWRSICACFVNEKKKVRKKEGKKPYKQNRKKEEWCLD